MPDTPQATRQDTPIDPPPASGWRARTPNALTLLRLLLTVVFVAVLSAGDTSDRTLLIAAAGFFIVAAITDALDGFLARKWNAISRFGRVMDPFADKLLILGAFVLLAGPAFAGLTTEGAAYQRSGVAPWMAVLILGRELLITSLRGLLESEGIDFSASWSGKIKMIAQSITVPAILLLLAFLECEPGTPSRGLVLGLAWGTTALTAWSAVPYISRARAARQAADA